MSTAGPRHQPKTKVMMAMHNATILSIHSVFPHISTPAASCVFISPILFVLIHSVIADLSISLAPVKRLFIILQFGRVQIFSLVHSREQTACYCWKVLATVLLGPVEASEAILPLPG